MLKDLPLQERPREKLLARGSQALADAELLALLLRTGIRGTSVLELARQVLERCRGFAGLLAAGPERLAGLRGLGPAKRAELLAVMEIARRAVAQPLAERPVIDTMGKLREYVALHLAGQVREVFAVLFLDAQYRLIALEPMFQGTVNQTNVFPREIVRRVIELHAAGVVLAHNHPSGVAEPSRADEMVTQTIRQALALIDVRVIDHLIVGQGQVVSLAERGLL
jgi:DNA repair protein RadC